MDFNSHTNVPEICATLAIFREKMAAAGSPNFVRIGDTDGGGRCEPTGLRRHAWEP
jgi:hypothetical protein